jgi:hypothetical protein
MFSSLLKPRPFVAAALIALSDLCAPKGGAAEPNVPTDPATTQAPRAAFGFFRQNSDIYVRRELIRSSPLPIDVINGLVATAADTKVNPTSRNLSIQLLGIQKEAGAVAVPVLLQIVRGELPADRSFFDFERVVYYPKKNRASYTQRQELKLAIAQDKMREIAVLALTRLAPHDSAVKNELAKLAVSDPRPEVRALAAHNGLPSLSSTNAASFELSDTFLTETANARRSILIGRTAAAAKSATRFIEKSLEKHCPVPGSKVVLRDHGALCGAVYYNYNGEQVVDAVLHIPVETVGTVANVKASRPMSTVGFSVNIDRKEIIIAGITPSEWKQCGGTEAFFKALSLYPQSLDFIARDPKNQRDYAVALSTEESREYSNAHVFVREGTRWTEVPLDRALTPFSRTRSGGNSADFEDGRVLEFNTTYGFGDRPPVTVTFMRNLDGQPVSEFTAVHNYYAIPAVKPPVIE